MSTETRSSGRPRDPAVEAAILRATQELLVDSGFERLTLRDVASRAGTGKAAIYRRWATKAELVIAAVRALYDPPAVPDLGTIRDDLIACAQHYRFGDAFSQRVLASLLSDLGRDPELRRAAFDAIGEPYSAPFRAVIERAIDRGEVRSDVDVDTIAGTFPAVAFHSTVIHEGGIDEATIVKVVDGVLLPALGVSAVIAHTHDR